MGGTKKEHLNCGNNLSVQNGIQADETINLYVLILARTLDRVKRKEPNGLLLH